MSSYCPYFVQCNNYSKGLITGSLCKPLCETKEIEFKKCLGHGIKLHVLRARWKTTTIVLKTSKTLGHRASTWLKRLSSRHNVDHDDFKLTRDEFIDAVSACKTKQCQRGRRRGGKGGKCPPTF